MASADGTLTIYTNVDTTGVNKGLSSIQKQMSNLQRTFGRFMTAALAVNFVHSAVEAASDLTEYQNVAYNTFKDQSDAFTEWIQNVEYVDERTGQVLRGVQEVFGMSELTATKIASSYQAMGNSIGLTTEKATDMSLTLTGLAGDMASFYNISQEQARTALAAVYTGETETMKQYGIMLQEVNLQQFAYTQGIQKSITNMTAAEKVALRYDYVLHSMADAQGDFARTANQWANQVRYLKEQWTTLLITIGNGFKALFSPVIRYMNAIIQKVISFVNVIGAALAKIFGLEFTEMKWVSNGVEDTASAVGDLAEATDDAGSAAKKAGKEAKRSLAAWDELTVLTQTDSSSGSGGSGSGGAGDGVGGGDLSEGSGGYVAEIAKAIESELDSLFEVGRYISDTLADMMESIDWQSIYKKAENFGKGLAEFLNGLITPRLFYDVGMTIAGALNTALSAAYGFVNEFDFVNLGESIGEGVNGFFENFDFEKLANTVDKWVQGVFKTIATAIATVDWGTVWDGVTDLLSNIDLSTWAILIGLKILGLGKKTLATALPMLIAEITGPIKTGLATAIGDLWAGITLIPEGLKSGMGLQETFVSIFGSVATTIAGIIAVVSGGILAITNFISMLTDGFNWVKEALMLVGIALAAVGAVLLGVPGTVAATVAAIVAVVATLVVAVKENWESIKSFLSPIIDWIETNICEPLAEAWDETVGVVIEAWEDLKTSISELVEAISNDILNGIEADQKYLSELFDWIKGIFDTLVTFIKVDIAVIVGIIATGFSTFFSIASNILGEILRTVGSVISSIMGVFSGLITFLTGVFSLNWRQALSGLVQMVASIFGGITAIVRGIANACVGIINGILTGIASGINAMISMLNKLKVTVPDWVPGYGGKSIGFNLSKVSAPKLPRLASGAVIPPNKEFMAILGDQKHGTNIETPLTTMIEAFKTALNDMDLSGGNDGDIVIEIDGKEVFRAVKRQNDAEYRRTGKNALAT